MLINNIGAGEGYTCGVTGDHSTYCCDRSDYVQQGDGSLNDRYQPSLVGDGQEFITVSAGLGSFGATTCGMAVDGSACCYCWGDGRGGQTGTGDAAVLTTPVRVYGQEG